MEATLDKICIRNAGSILRTTIYKGRIDGTWPRRGTAEYVPKTPPCATEHFFESVGYRVYRIQKIGSNIANRFEPQALGRLMTLHRPSHITPPREQIIQ